MFQPLRVKELRSPILIVAPHPDDDVLSSGGLIQRALHFNKSIYILYLTVGDAYSGVVTRYLHKPLIPESYIQLGKIRHNEAVKAEGFLGVSKTHLFFMCFPDATTLKIAESTSLNKIFQSNFTHFTHAMYPFAFQPDAPYNKRTAVEIIKNILLRVKPGTIILNIKADSHPDHKAARFLTLDGLKETTLRPNIYSYLIHYPDWPSVSGPFLPPLKLQSRSIRKLELTQNEFRNKHKAFQLMASEYFGSFLDRKYARNIEYFWVGK